VAFLPMTIAIVVTSTTVQTQLLPRLGAKRLIVGGMTLGVIAMISFTRLTPGGGYALDVLPGLIIIGLGMGCVFAPAFGTGTQGVEESEAGVASAMINTAQQVGGSVGTALLSTIFATAAASYAAAHANSVGISNAAAIHGDTTVFWWAAGIFAIGLLVALTVLPSRSAPHVTPAVATA
jgi:MFS family permease